MSCEQACEDLGIKTIIKNCQSCGNRSDNKCWFGEIKDMEYHCPAYTNRDNYIRFHNMNQVIKEQSEC